MTTPTAGLLQRSEPLEVYGVSKKINTTSRLHRLCHSLALDSLYLLGREICGNPNPERPKVILIRDFRTACCLSLLHVIPLSISIVLIVFNVQGRYIGGELSGVSGQDDLKMLGLQVAAKMLELLAMASLSVIILALIRKQLLTAHLPFGAVTAGFQFSGISLLWSKEFVAACGGSFGSLSAKIILLSAIVIATILGGTLGPAAATAAQPALRDWPAGGTSFYLNSTMGDLYPSVLDEVSQLEIPCLSSESESCSLPNYELLAGELLSHWPAHSHISEDFNLPQVLPEKTLITGKDVLRNLVSRLRGPFVFEPSMSVATVPLLATARAITKMADYWFMGNERRCRAFKEPCFRYYNDIFYSLQIPQPAAYVRCIPSDVLGGVKFSRVDQDIREYPTFALNESIASPEELSVLANATEPSIKWTTLPEEPFGETSVGAIVYIPGVEKYSPGSFLGCVVDARWASATAVRSFKDGPRLVQGFPKEYFWSGRYCLNSTGQLAWPRVKLTPRWAEHLDVTIPGHNLTTLAMLSKTVGRVGDINKVPRLESAIESILAVMLAEGMSRDRIGVRVQGSLKGFKENKFFPEWMTELGAGGSAFDFTPNASDEDNVTQFHLKITVNGYGYGKTTATLLACLVLLTYSIIAMSYVVYLLCCSRKTSASWDSIAEIIALSANSRQAPALRNTSAGITSLKTLKCAVSVRVCDGKVEMLFRNKGENVPNTGFVERVVTNEHYR